MLYRLIYQPSKIIMQKHSIALLGLGLLTLVLLTAAVVAAQTPGQDLLSSNAPQITHVQNVDASTAQALNSVFEKTDYTWPPAGEQSVPPLMLSKLPDDFADMPNADKRRELFLRALLPIILIENQRLHEQRELAGARR